MEAMTLLNTNVVRVTFDAAYRPYIIPRDEKLCDVCTCKFTVEDWPAIYYFDRKM